MPTRFLELRRLTTTVILSLEFRTGGWANAVGEMVSLCWYAQDRQGVCLLGLTREVGGANHELEIKY